MGNAHPKALRQRVIETLLEGATLDQVAQRFKVGRATAQRWMARYNQTGSYEAMPDSGGASTQKIFVQHEQAIVKWLQDQPDLTQLGLVKLLESTYHIQVSQATISNTLKRLGWSYKKKRFMTTAVSAP